MSARENILLIRLKSIGDVLFVLPAVHVVRENFPGSKISFLTSKENAALLEGFREVDEVIALDRARFQGGNPRAILSEAFSLLRRLRRGNFSLVVDFQGYGETAWLAWWTRAGERWGNVYQPMRAWAYTRPLKLDRLVHPAEGNLRLLQQCGLNRGPVRNEFVLPESALDEARRLLAASGFETARPSLIIQPFTSSPHKNWPLENYLKLADHWRNHGVQVFFGGGPAEQAALVPARQAGYPVFAGTPMLVSAGLMKCCTLIIGGDTGLLHAAIAMNKRLVMLMTREGAAKTHPFQHADWVIAAADREVVSIELRTVIAACAHAFEELEVRGL